MFRAWLSKYVLEQVAFTPNNAVNGLAGCTSNCAHRERFGCLFRSAIVACGHTLFNDLHLAVESRGATLDQWYISRQTHLVHVSASLEVV